MEVLRMYKDVQHGTLQPRQLWLVGHVDAFDFESNLEWNSSPPCYQMRQVSL